MEFFFDGKNIINRVNLTQRIMEIKSRNPNMPSPRFAVKLDGFITDFLMQAQGADRRKPIPLARAILLGPDHDRNHGSGELSRSVRRRCGGPRSAPHRGTCGWDAKRSATHQAPPLPLPAPPPRLTTGPPCNRLDMPGA